MNNIPHGSFLTISNALKQFPVLNSIIPEASRTTGLFHKDRVLQKLLNIGNIKVCPCLK